MFKAVLKYKRLLTLNMLLNRSRNLTMDDFREFNRELSNKIKRTDFIPYDKKGNLILNHKPIFKGWSVCKETSGEDLKVAMLTTKDNHYKIYFDTKEGAVVVSTTNMCDHCTYNDLAIFFEGTLELN